MCAEYLRICASSLCKGVKVLVGSPFHPFFCRIGREIHEMSSSSSISSDDERENSAHLPLPSPPGSRPSSRASSRCSSPQSPRKRRNGSLPSASGIGATLQNTVEELIQRDLLDTGVVVELANSKDAQQKLEDLLPIHFYSWRLKNVEAALVYTLLHMFVLLQQCNEMVRERSVYEDYISHLKARVEENQQPECGSQEHEREELVRLRRENAELRQEKAKLQASQSEVSCTHNEPTALYYYAFSC